MGMIASQITSLTIVHSTVYSDVDQRKHQSSASLAFVRGIHRRPVNSPHKWLVTRKMLPFDDVTMWPCVGTTASCRLSSISISWIDYLCIFHRKSMQHIINEIILNTSFDAKYVCQNLKAFYIHGVAIDWLFLWYSPPLFKPTTKKHESSV